MRIAVIGPPGSGKTKLVKRIGDELQIRRITGYVDSLRRESDLALGFWATYSENLMIAGHRMVREAKMKDIPYVISGSIIDSLCYAMIKTDIALSNEKADVQRVNTAAEAAVRGLGLMYSETFDYDLVFLTPYTNTQRKRKSNLERAFEVVYGDVIDAFDAAPVHVVEGSVDSRWEQAQEIIAQYQDLLEQEADEKAQ